VPPPLFWGGPLFSKFLDLPLQYMNIADQLKKKEEYFDILIKILEAIFTKPAI
jgi:hypothetical protein